MTDRLTIREFLSAIVILPVSVVFVVFLLGTEQLQAGTILTKIEFAQIPGWIGKDKINSFSAFRRSCKQMQLDNRAFYKNPIFGGSYEDWRPVCLAAQKLERAQSSQRIEQFFEANFTPFSVSDPNLKNGLFTGYFEPVVKGSLTKSLENHVPVYGRPDDLVTFGKNQEANSGLRYGRLNAGKPTPYFTRKQIEQGQLSGQGLELLWLRSYTDAFFMQVQGSGRVELPDGQTVRLAYAGKTGLPYTAIGAVLIKSGALVKSDLSMQSIRDWMDKNPDKSRELMWNNKSFVFFRRLQDTNPELGPVGAQHVNLTPEVSLAIDRRYWALGTPIWLDTEISTKSSRESEKWQSLMVAQDTGSAIRGFARGDVFWGSGESAGEIAGKMKAAGEMTVLLPKALAEKMEN